MPENDYRNFTADDFLQDEFFIRYMRNEDDETREWWNNWLAENPGRADVISEAQSKYRLLRSFKKNGVSHNEQKIAWQQIAARIDYPSAKIISINQTWLRAVAACLLVAVCIFLYNTYYPGTENTMLASNAMKSIELPDGTHIILNKNATLKTYSKRDREVWVNGEAYFEVNKVKNAAKNLVPFIVHAGDFDVKVTGTVFTVNTDEQAKGVVLAEGRVALTKGSKVVAMLPGDYVSVQGNNFVKTAVNPALYTAWKDEEFSFNNTSLNDLAILVKNVYGLELTVTNKQALQHRMLNGVVNITSVDGFMKTISVLLDVDIKQSPGRMVISPKTSN